MSLLKISMTYPDEIQKNHPKERPNGYIGEAGDILIGGNYVPLKLWPHDLSK